MGAWKDKASSEMLDKIRCGLQKGPKRKGENSLVRKDAKDKIH